jgi:catechol 2,3-dioxygenase-like lactoylglutathione lyase family enzyme
MAQTRSPTGLTPEINHIAIQTADLSNSIHWYQEFFGCRVTWSVDRFSELTLRRLPGITQLAELSVGRIRFHLFEVDAALAGDSGTGGSRFQHVCLGLGSGDELEVWRRRWIRLFESGRYRFARPERATEIIVDVNGSRSFYCLDVNGLEFELAQLPEASG